jgi:hypothetical protein
MPARGRFALRACIWISSNPEKLQTNAGKSGGRKWSLLVKAAGFLCACRFGEIFAPHPAVIGRVFLSFRARYPDNPANAYGMISHDPS